MSMKLLHLQHSKLYGIQFPFQVVFWQCLVVCDLCSLLVAGDRGILGVLSNQYLFRGSRTPYENAGRGKGAGHHNSGRMWS